jgi:hypothetical protein
MEEEEEEELETREAGGDLASAQYPRAQTHRRRDCVKS